MIAVFDDPLARIFVNEDHSADEWREIVVGHSYGRWLLLISFAEPEPDRVRIISARRATKKERHDYEDSLRHYPETGSSHRTQAGVSVRLWQSATEPVCNKSGRGIRGCAFRECNYAGEANPRDSIEKSFLECHGSEVGTIGNEPTRDP